MTGKRYNRIRLLLLCTVLVLPMAAQDYSVSRQINSANHLSNDFVTGLAIDGQGYVWAATESGLNRITGNTCTPIRTKTAWGTFTDNQIITALHYHAPTHLMLIGSENGLNLYDCKNATMREMDSDHGLVDYSINHISTANDHEVWLIYGNGQVQRLDCRTYKVSDLNIEKPMGNRCCYDDGKGHLYLGHSKDGMSIITLKDGKTRHYTHQKDDDESLPGNNVRCIYEDSKGRIWVGTDHGTALFHPSTGRFSKVTYREDTYDENVYDLLEMRDGTLWVATDMGGIHVVDLNQDTSGQPFHYDDTQVKLSSINSRSILQDEFGNIWVGNHSTGIDFISVRKPLIKLLDYRDSNLQMRRVYALSMDSDGSLWMGSEDELTRWKNDTLQGKWTIKSKLRRAHSYPRCLMADSKGYVWLGMEDEGIIRLNTKSGQFERLDIGHEAPDIHSFFEDSKGNIWIGTEFGVYLYTDNRLTNAEEVNRIIRNAPVTSFVELKGHEMVLTTLGIGIFTLHPSTHTSTHLRQSDGLPSDKINQAIADNRGGIWMATSEGLAHLSDPIHLKGITVYGREQGLSDNHVRALQQDAAGRIWVSTYSSISYLTPVDYRFHNYNQLDNHHLSGFSGGGAVTAPDGTIYFASASGGCYLHPQDFNDKYTVSDVQIVTCDAYNPVGSETEILHLTPDAKGRVYTNYRQNTLRLTFTVRNFAQTRHVEFSYMMRGMNDKWYYIDDDQDIVFRGLPPGHYTFILRAKLKNQNWEEASQTSIKIRISPPFWQTWWAYTLYTLTLLVAAWYLLRSYKRRLNFRNSLEMERRESIQKQELNEERLRFYTNITHELRTPLTLIVGPLEDLAEDRQLPDGLRRKVETIGKNAQRLRDLTSELLEFRKTETQNRRLTVARGNLGQFIREICLNWGELNRNPKVAFTYHIEEDLPPLYFDSEIVTTILNNLLSNAMKYTEEGSISVSVEREGGHSVRIAVTDTGYGISAQALPHIFERYYQAKGPHQASGTGIGLSIAKSLADLHEAPLTVESREGAGSRFTLTLDTTNTYPDALHKEDAPTPRPMPATSMNDGEGDEEEGHTPTLLIVEDNADIRQYIADSFGDDFHILQAKNGEEGVSKAFEHIPDIIVSDIMMPVKDGIALTKELKEDIRTSHIPIILLTAKVTDMDKEEGYESGADSYLTKPFTAKLLNSRIKNLLANRRRLAEQLSQPHSVRTDTPDSPASEKPTGDMPNEPRLSRLDREFLERLHSVVEANIMQEDIDMAFLTDKMAMSHSTFYRKVKALTGMTAKEYIRKLRLRHTYRLLESGDYNVTEAAMLTGFNQMAHFREIFKNEFGVLPSDVMKKNK